MTANIVFMCPLQVPINTLLFVLGQRLGHQHSVPFQLHGLHVVWDGANTSPESRERDSDVGRALTLWRCNSWGKLPGLQTENAVVKRGGDEEGGETGEAKGWYSGEGGGENCSDGVKTMGFRQADLGATEDGSV